MQEAELAVSWDSTIALQLGQQEWTSISKEKTSWDENHNIGDETSMGLQGKQSKIEDTTETIKKKIQKRI